MHVKKLYHCAYALSYHLVLVTRYRRRCLDAAMLGDLKGILEKQLQLKGGTLLEFNGEPDHVHLLLELPPSHALSVAVTNFKSVSSRPLRKRHGAALEKFFRRPVLWSRSYFISSVGGANLGRRSSATSKRRSVRSDEGDRGRLRKMAWRASPRH
jgi:putative transposase